MIQHKEWEMSISLQDFFRILPIALDGFDYEVTNTDQINIFLVKGKVEILPGKEHKRKIASLELPVLFVVFNFVDTSEDEVLDFLTHFAGKYQRGGG